jgi:DNA-nicking Smr family endonuclease
MSKKDNPFSKLKDLKLEPPAKAKPKAAPAKAPKVTAEDEALAFQRMMSGVKPLESGPTRIPASGAPAGASATKRAVEHARANAAREEEEVHARLDALVESRFEVQDDGRRAEGRRTEIPPDVVRKLRRGHFPIDGRLDLHGLGASDARTTLEAWLREMRAKRERCVLVIHGKGTHSPGGTGILRGELSAWLSEGRAAASVDAFATAQGEDGGEGATYVLLRR